MCLFKLATQKELPLHQNLDEETLSWIKSNVPDQIKNIDFSELAREVDLEKISCFVPMESWFLSESRINSLHGIRHLIRTTIYAHCLGLKLHEKQLNNLLIATSLHDISRKNDKNDMGHSSRALKWYQKNKRKVLSKYKVIDVDNNIIENLIKFHELNYEDLGQESFYKRNEEMVNIIKTADALDRYVQPRKKWWMNEKYLKIIPSIELKAFAFNLVVSSEEKHLRGIDSKNSVLLSLKEFQGKFE